MPAETLGREGRKDVIYRGFFRVCSHVGLDGKRRERQRECGNGDGLFC